MTSKMTKSSFNLHHAVKHASLIFHQQQTSPRQPHPKSGMPTWTSWTRSCPLKSPPNMGLCSKPSPFPVAIVPFSTVPVALVPFATVPVTPIPDVSACNIGCRFQFKKQKHNARRKATGWWCAIVRNRNKFRKTRIDLSINSADYIVQIQKLELLTSRADPRIDNSCNWLWTEQLLSFVSNCLMRPLSVICLMLLFTISIMFYALSFQ